MNGRNVEIKARVKDGYRIRSVAEEIADSEAVLIEQADTFFNCVAGRLKLRKLDDSHGELIHYNRPDAHEPTGCDYTIVETSEPDKLGEMLGEALGVRGVVCKRRTLYTHGQTRIHLDDVEGLGEFVELEVVLAEGQSVEEGSAIAESIMETLRISDEDLLDAAYIDMIEY